MIWPPSDPDAVDLAGSVIRRLGEAPWRDRPRFGADGLLLLSLSKYQGSREITPIDTGGGLAGGAVFGRLFERTCVGGRSSLVRCITPSAAQALVSGGSDVLMSRYWGRYIAFIRAGSGWSVTADPTSSVPCFHATRGGLTMVFSHLEACDFLDRSRFTVNYGFLSRLLAYDRIQTGETGLNEVRELAGGETLTVTAQGCSAARSWDPFRIAREHITPGLPEAAGLLYHATRDVVAAWQASSDETLISLSGGLDSAIVLSCLCDAGRGADITAVHHYLGDADLPETGFAREAARLAGCAFHLVGINPGHRLPDPDGHPLSARPFRQYLGSGIASQLGNHPERPGAAIFTGQGGDHLFLKTQSPLGFSDYVRHHGPGPGLLRELVHASRLSGQSALSVLHTHFTGRNPYSGSPSADPHRLQRNENSLDPSPHAKKVARGKLEQVRRLPHLFQLREPLIRSDFVDIVHPLISQPLVELCLRLPVYVLAAGGISRGLARLAFKGRIPDAVRLRMTKGSASGHFSDLLAANAAMLESVLSRGALVSSGLLSDGDFRPLLARNSHRVSGQAGRLLVFYTVEAWLRRWSRELSAAPR